MRTPPKTGGEYGEIKKRELNFLAIYGCFGVTLNLRIS